MDRSTVSKPLLDVLEGRSPQRRPIWLMRQAGRYLPEYREVRAKAGSFLDLCYNPVLATEVTLQPLRRFDLDAAILFSDILVLPHAMGLDVSFKEGEGPVLETVRDRDRVRDLSPVKGDARLAKVFETVSRLKGALSGKVALIGFCGAPWTVGSYMVEGGSSDRENAREIAYRRESWFLDLLERLTEESAEYLCGQIEAGADAVQIFDSWAGELPEGLTEDVVMKPLERLVAAVRRRYPQVPVIVFAKGLGVSHKELIERIRPAAVGIETELPMRWATAELSASCAIQGNLDPLALLAGKDVAVREARRIVSAIPRNRHIFNLGHGIRQTTPVDTVTAVIEAVRSFDGAG